MARIKEKKPDERETHRFTGSSRVDRAWYTEDTKTLQVLFVDGTRWTYTDVRPATWRRFKSSGSAGRFVTEILDHFANHPG